ncbi:MAG: cupin domain-containing protein [Leptospiraceae bacterium]|nr:cupin domain-containing protein [Leptospiraceae bacterium]MCP5498420.1 cupin domain-containing protein [Leptospiraceae bacterium]
MIDYIDDYKLKSFLSFKIRTGLLYDLSHTEFPSMLYAWNKGSILTMENPKQRSTYFGYIFSGRTILETPYTNSTLIEGQYFSINSEFTLTGGCGVLIERSNYKGMNLIGGPLEDEGRLKYIDGCTDTLLLAPPKFGEACLNALFFPENVNQSPHKHPSFRAGIVAKGRGECVVKDSVIALEPGDIFIIPGNSEHNFRTKDEKLSVIAFHPDSDFGPTDENHPMINRTFII